MIDLQRYTEKPFHWTARARQAAALLAEDFLTDNQIAKKVKTCRRTVATWKLHPEFAAEVAALAQKMGDRCARLAIARKHRRVAALDDRVRRLKRVIAGRAGNAAHRAAPGGDTGLLARKLKMIGSGENATVVEEFEVDGTLLRELREHEKQAAQELGQWVERKDLNVSEADIDALVEQELAGAADAGGQATLSGPPEGGEAVAPAP